MPHIRRHDDHSLRTFLKRTVSAQLHLLGLLAAIAGLAILMHYASQRGDIEHIWACLTFSLTSIFVFAMSTGYHFVSDGYIISKKLQKQLEDLDHFAIFLFIAGTYTPFILNVIKPPWQMILLTTIWTVGILGIIYTHYRPRLPAWARHRLVYTGIFLLMGWTLVIRLGEALSQLSPMATTLLVAGGLSYSVGALIYAFKWPNFFKGSFGFHELWHVMVLLGFSFHYLLILSFYRT
jgi:hemolysin III